MHDSTAMFSIMNRKFFYHSKTATRGVLWQKLFLKISQYSQENVFIKKNFIKKRLQHRRFPVKIAKFLRTPTIKYIYERLFLIISFYEW